MASSQAGQPSLALLFDWIGNTMRPDGEGSD